MSMHQRESESGVLQGVAANLVVLQGAAAILVVSVHNGCKHHPCCCHQAGSSHGSCIEAQLWHVAALIISLHPAFKDFYQGWRQGQPQPPSYCTGARKVAVRVQLQGRCQSQSFLFRSAFFWLFIFFLSRRFSFPTAICFFTFLTVDSSAIVGVSACTAASMKLCIFANASSMFLACVRCFWEEHTKYPSLVILFLSAVLIWSRISVGIQVAVLRFSLMSTLVETLLTF
mmetsp:Transcript_19772/g.58666  ORF Transcript_19772/g.58666 Transcript_19772/m.58666 type:complete len:229 (+) Transcript_19772:319-1005(+)